VFDRYELIHSAPQLTDLYYSDNATQPAEFIKQLDSYNQSDNATMTSAQETGASEYTSASPMIQDNDMFTDQYSQFIQDFESDESFSAQNEVYGSTFDSAAMQGEPYYIHDQEQPIHVDEQEQPTPMDVQEQPTPMDVQMPPIQIAEQMQPTPAHQQLFTYDPPRLYNAEIGWYYPALHHRDIGPYMPASDPNQELCLIVPVPNQAQQVPAFASSSSPVPAMEGSSTAGPSTTKPRKQLTINTALRRGSGGFISASSIIQHCICARPKAPGKPANDWILYRSHNGNRVAKEKKLNGRELMEQLRHDWAHETPEVRTHYKRQYEKAKAKHAERYNNRKQLCTKRAYQFGYSWEENGRTVDCTCGAFEVNIEAHMARKAYRRRNHLRSYSKRSNDVLAGKDPQGKKRVRASDEENTDDGDVIDLTSPKRRKILQNMTVGNAPADGLPGLVDDLDAPRYDLTDAQTEAALMSFVGEPLAHRTRSRTSQSIGYTEPAEVGGRRRR
jgi:hypothetical protein